MSKLRSSTASTARRIDAVAAACRARLSNGALDARVAGRGDRPPTAGRTHPATRAPGDCRQTWAAGPARQMPLPRAVTRPQSPRSPTRALASRNQED